MNASQDNANEKAPTDDEFVREPLYLDATDIDAQTPSAKSESQHFLLAVPISRRTALKRLRLLVGGAAALVVAEAGVAGLIALYNVPVNSFGGPIKLGPKSAYPAATPQECVLGSAGVFYIEQARCFLVHLSAQTSLLMSGTALADTLASESILRDRDGSYWLALYRACTHLGTTVRFLPCHEFRCPSHGASYACSGEYLDGPPPRSLDRFPVTFNGNTVVVDTGRLNMLVDRPSFETRLLPVPGAPCPWPSE